MSVWLPAMLWLLFLIVYGLFRYDHASHYRCLVAIGIHDKSNKPAKVYEEMGWAWLVLLSMLMVVMFRGDHRVAQIMTLVMLLVGIVGCWSLNWWGNRRQQPMTVRLWTGLGVAMLTPFAIPPLMV